MNDRILRWAGTALLLPAFAAACSSRGAPTSPAATAELLNVAPAGGSTGVSVDTTVTVTFDHAMNPAMSEYADLHEGDLSGSVVDGTWAWSADTTVLTFTPSAPLKPATTYTIHLGGGMKDADGEPVDMDRYGPDCGGQTATAGMMGGAGGMMGSGGQGAHMGQGWQGADGDYGMIFTFTTAG